MSLERKNQVKSPRAAWGPVAACLALLLISACSSGSANKAAEGNVTVGSIQAWTGFNSFVPDQGSSIGIALSNVIHPSAFNVQPGQTAALNTDLLESAELVSTAPQTVVYKIKKSAVWSDGTPITVEDFKYLWSHLNGSNDKLLVTNAIGYSQIKSVAADGNDKTVKVVFSSPFGDWKAMFATLLPAHYMKTRGVDADAWNRGLVKDAGPSGGAFTVVENRPDQFVRLERNPKWYGTEAKIKALTVRFLSDDQAVVQALASGEVDFPFELKATQALTGQVKAIGDMTSAVVPTTNQYFINTQFSNSEVGNLPVRQAIATAVDPAALAKTVIGDGSSELLTSNHVFAPSSPNYTDDRPEGYGSGDIAAAEKILEDAGYVKNSNGVYAKNGAALNLTYIVRAEDELGKQVGVILQNTLKKVGIAINIKPIASADWYATAGTGKFDLALGNYPATAFPVSFYSSLYPCKGGYNFAKYCNEKVDALYNKATSELDAKKQAATVHEIDQQLWADVANIPVFEAPVIIAHRNTLKGVEEKLPKEWQLFDAKNWSTQK